MVLLDELVKFLVLCRVNVDVEGRDCSLTDVEAVS